MTTLDYRPIAAMVQMLPRDCRWTSDQRDRWLLAMTGVVDLLVEVTDLPTAEDVYGILTPTPPTEAAK